MTRVLTGRVMQVQTDIYVSRPIHTVHLELDDPPVVSILGVRFRLVAEAPDAHDPRRAEELAIIAAAQALVWSWKDPISLRVDRLRLSDAVKALDLRDSF